VFESTTITGATLSQKETVATSTSNSSVMQSFQTVHKKKSKAK
jgi:hypothetical protein